MRHDRCMFAGFNDAQSAQRRDRTVAVTNEPSFEIYKGVLVILVLLRDSRDLQNLLCGDRSNSHLHRTEAIVFAYNVVPRNASVLQREGSFGNVVGTHGE